MLILTRRIEESIIINSNIIVKVIRLNSKQVALGVETPPGMSVHREEIQRRIEEERLFNLVLQESML